MRSRKVSPGLEVMRIVDPVRKNARASGNSGAIATRFADDGGGFAGDGRFVDRGDAFDDFTIASDELAGFDLDDVAGTQLRTGNRFSRAVGAKTVGHGFALGFAQRVSLRFAAAFGDGLGEVSEENREPEPQRDLEIEADGLMADRFFNQQSSGDDAADFDDEHDRVLHHQARVELGEGVDDGLAEDVGIPETLLFCHEDFSTYEKRTPMLQQQVFKNRTEAESGEESERAHDENDASEQDGEERSVHGKGSGRRWNAFLAGEIAGQSEHGDIIMRSGR